jgi:LmbE family N-acetylglucosaminyl deacetylase
MLEKKPEKIFTHSPADPHPDHRDVLDAVLKAVDKARLKCDVYCFDIWNPLTFRKSNLPRLYVDVTATFGRKIEALKAFRSQKFAISTLFLNVVIKSFIHAMQLKKSRYAERFYKIR